MLELAGKVQRDELTANHIKRAVANDEELSELLSNILEDWSPPACFRAVPIILPEHLCFGTTDIIGDLSLMAAGAYVRLRLDVDELCMSNEMSDGAPSRGALQAVLVSGASGFAVADGEDDGEDEGVGSEEEGQEAPPANFVKEGGKEKSISRSMAMRVPP